MPTMHITDEVDFSLSKANLAALGRMQVPVPTKPAQSIIQQLMARRNERSLHRRKCDFTGENIISAYPAETPFPVYKNEVWWSDQWDPMQYGRDFDFSKTFFEQFAELINVVPREGTSVFNSENCDYNGHCRRSRNCYMSTLIAGSEDVHYSYWIVNAQDMMDCYFVNNSTLCYDCIDGENLYNCIKIQDCLNCQDCYFSYQLIGCNNCIACSNLQRKDYHILNEPVSKEEFDRVRSELLSGTRSGYALGEELFQQMWGNAINRCFHNINCENSVGDHLLNCKNTIACFDATEVEDCAYCISMSDSKDILFSHSAGWPRCELVHCSAVSRGSTNIAYCYYTFHSSNLRYCDSSMTINNCFGCTGLRHKDYCIFNKQYTPDEYEKLSNRIIEHMKETGEWGEYFPIHHSTFAYNDSAAQDYFPLSEEEVLGNGWVWRDEESTKAPAGAKPVPNIPISQVTDDICKEVFICEESGRPFRFVKQELSFYRKMNLPLPTSALDARFRSRLDRRNPHQIVARTCSETGEKILSSYGAEHQGRVCSEDYYVNNVLA